jgi:hypothetical protein
VNHTTDGRDAGHEPRCPILRFSPVTASRRDGSNGHETWICARFKVAGSSPH